MSRYTVIALLCTFCLTANSNTVEQSDWCAGPGENGPVTEWALKFQESQCINWADKSGELTLQTTAEDHLIASDFGNASFLACADYNNDGQTDVACASYGDNQLAWFENLGNGASWEEHLIESYLPEACVISTGDIDQNGMPDLMCASEGGDGICWWRNNNWAESWTKNEVDPSCTYPFSVEPADFDGDNDIDLCGALFGKGDIVWYSNDDSLGTQWTTHIIEDGFPQAWWAVPGDFNCDNIPDVAGARHGGEINWWENDGSGNFTVEHSIATGYTQCTTIRNCDLNGDNVPDVAATSNNGRLAWWENSSQGSAWTQHIIDDDLTGAWSLWAEDMDNDGDQDVIGNDRKGDCVYWYENLDGSGTLWMRWLLNQGMDMSNDVNAADLDNDGIPDPIATFGGDNTVYWWKLSDEFQLEGTLHSSVLDMGQDAQWGEISWTSTEQTGTQVQVSVRAGSTVETMSEWALIPYSGTDLSAYIPDNSRYFQYLVTLVSEGSESPTLNDISLDWIPMGVSQGEMNGTRLGLPHPNPVSGSLTIPLVQPQGSYGEIRIMDQTGRCIFITSVHGNAPVVQTDCSDLPAGAYHVTLINGEKLSSAAFTVLD